MITGKTKSGIKFSINENVKKDTRFIQYATEMQSGDEMEQTQAFFDLMKMMFGGRKGLIAFQEEVAKKHDGICDTEILTKEFTEIIEIAGLKN